MNQRFGNDRNWNDVRDRGPDDDWNEERNMWSGREEDGGFGRRHEEEWMRGSGRDPSWGGQRQQSWRDTDEDRAGQRGYGRGIYGESGLGETEQNELHHGLGAGGYHPSSSSSGRGSASYGGGSSGYGASSSYGSGSAGFRGFRSGGGYAGRGPKGYTRADERIREDVCDRLSQDDDVDASDITVRVQSGEVTLEGTTENRRQKRLAEEIAAEVSGVNDVHNNVRVRKGLLTELKDKVTGDDHTEQQHYAGGGTKTTTDERRNEPNRV